VWVAGCRATGEQSSPELTGGDAARERPRAFYPFSATANRLDGSIILHRHERHSMHHTPPVQQVNVRTMSACSVLS